MNSDLLSAEPGPTEQQAYDMGAKGAPATDAERMLFEAWMRGHCWALCATWDGKGYRSDAEQGGNLDPLAMATRRLWAAWRDRAALATSPAIASGVPAWATPAETPDKAKFWAWWEPYQLPDGWIARLDLIAWHAWQAAQASVADQPVDASPADMVMVSREFIQGFGRLAHNYQLQAVPPDYYQGVEGDAFRDAYARCGAELKKLRDLLPTTKGGSHG